MFKSGARQLPDTRRPRVLTVGLVCIGRGSETYGVIIYPKKAVKESSKSAPFFTIRHVPMTYSTVEQGRLAMQLPHDVDILARSIDYRKFGGDGS